MKLYQVDVTAVYRNYENPKDNSCVDNTSANVLANSAMDAAQKYIAKLAAETSTTYTDDSDVEHKVKAYKVYNSVDLESVKVIVEVDVK